MLVAGDPVRRWALADALHLSPREAVAGDEGIARLLHPAGVAAAAIVQLVVDDDDVALLGRLVRRARRPVVAVVTTPRLAARAMRTAPAVTVPVDGDAAPHELAAAVTRGLDRIGLRDERIERTAS